MNLLLSSMKYTNTTLFRVGQMISKSGSRDAILTSIIGMLGIIISELITLYLFHRQTSNTALNLQRKLRLSRRNSYDNALHVYIYKKLDTMCSNITNVMNNCIRISAGAEVGYKNNSNDKFLAKVIRIDNKFIKSDSVSIGGYFLQFVTIKDSLKNLNANKHLNDNKLIKEILVNLIKLNINMIHNRSVLLNSYKYDKISLFQKIHKYTYDISIICRDILPKIIYVTQYHTFAENATNINDELMKYSLISLYQRKDSMHIYLLYDIIHKKYFCVKGTRYKYDKNNHSVIISNNKQKQIFMGCKLIQCV